MQRLIRVPACLAFALLLSVFSFAQIQPQDRIVEAIDESQVKAVPGHLHSWAQPAFDQGRLNSGTQLQGVSLIFRLSASQQADLNQLLADQQDPASPNYHKWLTPEQYAARFGMSQSDLNRVVTWLQSQGFANIRIARGNNRISFDGTVARLEAAFHTEMHNYAVNGVTHFANATEPAVPAGFADTVLGFRHLDNYNPKPRSQKIPMSRFTSSQSGNHFLSPGDFATIYDLTPLYNEGIDGTGIAIAVIGQTAINVNDINTFRSLSGLSSNPPIVQQVANTGTSMTCPGDIDEASLDVEWSGGVAKNATIIYDYAGVDAGKTCDTRTFNAFDALFDAIDNNLAAVVSISYGNCEANIGMSNAVTLQQEMQKANSQGQTISAASGDAGAADCEPASSTSATTGLAVDIPGAIPEVTAVGGTEFTGDTTAGADPPYWAAATNNTTDNVSSALQYIPEMAWNDSPSGTNLDTHLSASGGGVSTFFAKPSWQTALTPADSHRDVPDVSVAGSPNHDGYLVCSQSNCVNGFRKQDGSLSVFGGTSVSAQALAGIIALLNQATKSIDPVTNTAIGMGNINPQLYTLAGSHASAFHDITTGSNIVPCKQGSTGCPASSPFQFGFNAATGYDLVTGLGSVDGNVLAQAWPGFNLTPTATTTTLAADNANVLAGTTVNFTATITEQSANGEDITGTVQFTIDGTNSGSPVPVAFSSTAKAFVATLSTSSLGVGTHQITAAYSGSGNPSPNYASSQTSAAITETITGFTVAPPPAAATVSAPGGSATSPVTVAPNTTGATGTVNLTCTSPGSEISCSLNPASVNVTSGSSSVNSTLTIVTTAPHARSTTVARNGSGHLGWFTASGGALFAGVFMLGAPSRRRWSAMLGLLFCVFLSVGVGCGGGSNSNGGGGNKDPGTPVGSYTITVTGTSGTVTQTANVTVTVQ